MSYRSFKEVWQDIGRLEGKDVFTLCRRYKSHIKQVNENGVVRYADRGKGEFKDVSKTKFERVWRELIEDGKFVPSKKSEGTSFTCACIAHLPEVEYSCKDGSLRLYLSQQNTHPFCEVKEYME